VRIRLQSGFVSTACKWDIGVAGARLLTSTATTPTVFYLGGTLITGTTAPPTTPTCLNTTDASVAVNIPLPARWRRTLNALSPRSHPRPLRCHCHCPGLFLNHNRRPPSKRAARSITTKRVLHTAAIGSSHELTTRRALEGTIGPSFPNDVDKAAGGHI
jgi:hypothetical protein